MTRILNSNHTWSSGIGTGTVESEADMETVSCEFFLLCLIQYE